MKRPWTLYRVYWESVWYLLSPPPTLTIHIYFSHCFCFSPILITLKYVLLIETICTENLTSDNKSTKSFSDLHFFMTFYKKNDKIKSTKVLESTSFNECTSPSARGNSSHGERLYYLQLDHKVTVTQEAFTLQLQRSASGCPHAHSARAAPTHCSLRLWDPRTKRIMKKEWTIFSF
jgi:hypothetical protein